MTTFQIGAIDEVIHGRVRLGVMAYLAAVDDFVDGPDLERGHDDQPLLAPRIRPKPGAAMKAIRPAPRTISIWGLPT